MQSSSPFADDAGDPKRRSFFGRASQGPDAAAVEAALAEYQRRLEERLDRGLAAIQSSAVSLMKEIASEMWRRGGADAGDNQARILEFVSRDQAIRGLIAHSDERFQALAVRTQRLEDALQQVNRSNAQLTEHIARSARALADVAESPALQNVDGLREQLEQVERHVASTIAYIAERDKDLVENIKAQVQENGDLIGRETGRIVEAMQAYVSDGVDTMGRLAQRMESHIDASVERDDDLTERIHAQIQTTLGEQIQLIYERLGIEARTLADTLSSHEAWMGRSLEAVNDRTAEQLGEHLESVRQAAREPASEISHLLEARVIGLAQLVRSDSEALRRRLVESAAAQDEAMGRMLDERLVRVLEAVDQATLLTVDESSRRIAEATDRAIDGRVEEITLMLDRNLVVLKEKLDDDLRAVGSQTAEAVSSALDQRIGGLARMIRSDNEALANRMQTLADAEPAKQTLRAVKEMEASLGNEMLTAMDRKFSILADQLHRETQSMAESFAKSADVLSRKIDRMQSQAPAAGAGMQTAIEKMGDAMHALASIGRSSPPSDERLDLE
jgi:hypothetical protein